jgi:hypothetical protein
MGLFDWLTRKSGRTGSTPQESSQSPSSERAANEVVLGNWRVLSGLSIERTAMAQNIIEHFNCAVVLLKRTEPSPDKLTNVSGTMTCHACRALHPLAKRMLLGSGLESSEISCNCGSRMTLMATGTSDPGHAYLVLSPLVTAHGRLKLEPGLVIHGLVDEDDSPRASSPDVPIIVAARVLTGHTGPVLSIAVSPDGRFILSGGGGKSWQWDGDDPTGRLWDLESGEELRQFIGHRDSVEWVWFVENSAHVMTAGGDINGAKEFCFRVWERDSGNELRRIDSPSQKVSTMAASRDGQLIAFGEGFGQTEVYVCDTSTRRERLRLDEHTNSLRMSFSADGSKLLSAAGEQISWWDLDTGRLVYRLRGVDEVYGLALSPDGRFAAFGGYGKFVAVWNLSDGRETRRMTGHTKTIMSVAFHPDGLRVASAGGDTSISLWEIETGRETARFDGHDGEVTNVVFTPDGRFLVSASHDKTIRVWPVP